MSPDYVVAYELSSRFPDLWFAAAGMIPMLIGLVTMWGKRRFGWQRPHWAFSVCSLAFGLIWLVTVASTLLVEDERVYSSYRNGSYSTVEGMVSNFRPMLYSGHQDECFSVKDQEFCYSDYAAAPGFRNSTSHGGPLREGLPVRIAFRDGRILRLEVPAGSVPTAEQSAAVEREEQLAFQGRMSTILIANTSSLQLQSRRWDGLSGGMSAGAVSCRCG